MWCDEAPGLPRTERTRPEPQQVSVWTRRCVWGPSHLDTLLPHHLMVLALLWRAGRVLVKRLWAGAVGPELHMRPAVRVVGLKLGPLPLLCCRIDGRGHDGLHPTGSVYAHLETDSCRDTFVVIVLVASSKFCLQSFDVDTKFDPFLPLLLHHLPTSSDVKFLFFSSEIQSLTDLLWLIALSCDWTWQAVKYFSN